VHRLALLIVLVACQTKQEPAPKADPPPPPPVKPEAPPAPAVPVVDLAPFAKDCKEATDCVLVKRAWCDPCACAVDAIASKEMAKFDDAANKLECGPPDLDRQMACGGCESRKATCTSGQCVLAEATP
ncbi:MAG: hypothetical protein AB7T06_41355, partial [Kofleriaceae bacterium]